MHVIKLRLQSIFLVSIITFIVYTSVRALAHNIIPNGLQEKDLKYSGYAKKYCNSAIKPNRSIRDSLKRCCQAKK